MWKDIGFKMEQWRTSEPGNFKCHCGSTRFYNGWKCDECDKVFAEDEVEIRDVCPECGEESTLRERLICRDCGEAYETK